ncbi:hypothetical protein SARC_02060 [Sphaeroforma arctica JP610]|uniref:Uncharacterized protein n=1 Tax=Sphaeroforma arctica JP610 TaxID=667725 RepID=A0A0L0GA48_9EUKA|nr:hypothetical protein SARC_02060 [Sphaeroforma arctica JP610]KNC85756.1 hypothetical protein SARC_02060 [Sphaeroforma arctica JP610]|eukprot:XP_014159658.1 hypothetical protein SARC_02060 [Sphaeroforma arctica JP610]
MYLALSLVLALGVPAQLLPADDPIAEADALSHVLESLQAFGDHEQPRSTHPGSIFVSLVSFRDDQMEPTVNDMLDKAADPSRIVFGIMCQDKLEVLQKPFSFESRSDFNGKVLRLPYKETRGTCWARHAVQRALYNNETYYMQLDSHHRFTQNWDEKCIDNLNMAYKKSAKPILTQYLNGFSPATEGQLNTEGDRVTRLSAIKYYETGKARIQPEHSPGLHVEPQLQIALISGHFIFCDGSWVYEVPYDPYLIFEGEEDTLGLRSYTHGWDMYHTAKPLAWHYYERPQGYRFPATRFNTDNSEARLRRITEGPGPASDYVRYPEGYDFGQYGLGADRGWEDYFRQSGIFWNKRYLHEKTRKGDPNIVISDEEYEEIMNMTPWAVTRDCGGQSMQDCFNRGCRWVEGFPGPYCQDMDQPLKDCGFPGVQKHSCESLGGTWVPDSPGPDCQYGVPKFPGDQADRAGEL